MNGKAEKGHKFDTVKTEYISITRDNCLMNAFTGPVLNEVKKG